LRWFFPDTVLEPGELMIVYLSGKNKIDPGSNLHTNFSLSSSEPLLLNSFDLVEFNIMPPREMPKDVSYGRQADGSMAFFGEPTPGAPNITQGYSGICAPPEYSHTSGFYTENINLSIVSTDGSSVIYSTDGSIPREENIASPLIFEYKNSFPFLPTDPFGPFLTDSNTTYGYVSPILVEDRSALPDRLSRKSSTKDFQPTYFPEEPSFKGTVIRARSVAEGKLPSEIVSKVFFITPEGRNRYNLPVTSLILDEVDLFEYEQGIHTAGKVFDDWRQENPDLFPPPIGKANYGERGITWEKEGHFDYFDKNSSATSISAELGIRMNGESSRRFPRKSFRLSAKNLYGSEALIYPFFPNHFTQRFERLILHNSGGDERFANMRNAAVQRMAYPTNATTSSYQPHYLFLNGEFYGLNILKERFDENYFQIRYGILPENLNLIIGLDDIAAGNSGRYLALNNLCLNGFLPDLSLEQFDGWVDVESYADVYIVNMITSNADMFPKNTLWWRDNSPGASDNSFYSVLIDQDRTLGMRVNGALKSPSYNMVSHFLEETTELITPYLTCFIEVMKTDEFRRYFINRTGDVLNSYFKIDRTVGIVEDMREAYLPHYEEQIERWSGDDNMQSVDEWMSEVDTIIDFLEKRPDLHRKHISEFFETDGTYRLSLDVSDEEQGYIHINTIDVIAETEGINAPVYPWKGTYFKNVSIDLKALPNPGYIFSHWEGDITETSIEVNSTFDADSVYIKAVFIPNPNLETDHVGVYPNPFNGSFFIANESENLKRYTIYDSLGKKIIESRPTQNETIEVRFEGQAGVYILEAEYADGKRKQAKLVKY